jgi:hypothetical protein
MSLSVDGAKAIVGLRPSEESRMKSTNASELDRKSRVSLGEPWGTRRFSPTLR